MLLEPFPFEVGLKHDIEDFKKYTTVLLEPFPFEVGLKQICSCLVRGVASTFRAFSI